MAVVMPSTGLLLLNGCQVASASRMHFPAAFGVGDPAAAYWGNM